MVAIRESEAVVVRDLCARLLGGESLHSLSRWLDAEGITGTEGGKFTGPNLRHLLMRPHLAGLRVHRGQVVGEGQWQPIISTGTHEAVVALLSDASRRTSTSNARVYLLAGLATCATCGGAVRGRPGYKAKGRAYACETGRHVHRQTEGVDLYVSEAIIRRLELLDAAGAFKADEQRDEVAHLRHERDALAQRLDDVVAAYSAGDLSLDMMRRTTAHVESELVALDVLLADAQVAQARPAAALAGMTGRGARQAWEGASLGRQRAIIDTLATIQLQGSAPGRREKFDAPTHVLIHWRDQ
jgi:hypothetical protein